MIDVKLLKKISNFKKFATGEIIVRENDRDINEMYVIVSGSVNVYKSYGLFDEVLLAHIEAGEFFGEMSLFLNKPRSATVVASEDTALLALSKDNFFSFSEQAPEAIFQFIATICRRLSTTNDEKVQLAGLLSQWISKYGHDESVGMKGIVEQSKNEFSYAKNDIVDSNPFPEKHKKYNIKASDEHKQYLVNIKVKCPNCKEEFNTNKVLMSQLKQDGKLRCDLRRHYKDIMPEWYEVYTCPHCYFSTFEHNFSTYVNLPTQVKNILLNYKEKLKFDYASGEKNVDMVFASYYFALLCSHYYKDSYYLISKIWRHLAWIYEDIKDEEMEIFATEKAFDASVKYFENSVISDEGTQVLMMVTGALANRLGRLDDAYKYLGNAKFIKEGKRIYKMMIDGELYDVRRKMKELQE